MTDKERKALREAAEGLANWPHAQSVSAADYSDFARSANPAAVLSLLDDLAQAETKLAKAREAFESIDAVAIDYGHLESAARTMKELAATAYKETSE